MSESGGEDVLGQRSNSRLARKRRKGDDQPHDGSVSNDSTPSAEASVAAKKKARVVCS